MADPTLRNNNPTRMGWWLAIAIAIAAVIVAWGVMARKDKAGGAYGRRNIPAGSVRPGDTTTPRRDMERENTFGNSPSNPSPSEPNPTPAPSPSPSQAPTT